MSDTFWGRLRTEIPWVNRQLRRMGVPARDVDDVTQQVLIQVCSRWTEYDGSRPLRPWLQAFLARAAANHRRLMLRRREELGAEGDVRDTLPDWPFDAVEQGATIDARAVVLEALEAVDDDRRAALFLVELEGLSAPEAALKLQIPLNTMYSRLRLGRAEFVAAVRRTQARRGER